MAQKPLTMEHIKQVLQLQSDGVSIREIARRLGISRNSVRKYLGLLQGAYPGTDRELALHAYGNDSLEHDALRIEYFTPN